MFILAAQRRNQWQFERCASSWCVFRANEPGLFKVNHLKKSFVWGFRKKSQHSDSIATSCFVSPIFRAWCGRHLFSFRIRWSVPLSHLLPGFFFEVSPQATTNKDWNCVCSPPFELIGRFSRGSPGRHTAAGSPSDRLMARSPPSSTTKPAGQSTTKSTISSICARV